MSILPEPDCRIDALPACFWAPHRLKHFWAYGITRRDTEDGETARYLPSFNEAAILRIESSSVRSDNADRAGTLSTGKRQYLKNTVEVIGWDEGSDATLSYVECSGGIVEGRAFHGRPMRAENRTAGRLRRKQGAE